MDPAKSTHGTAHGWLAAERPALGADSELPDGEALDELLEELCEATIVRLDAAALEALFQKARA